MNKEKAIKEIKKASESFYACDYIKTKVAESIISKIHEPQKVVVPKFVAEWIKWCKTNNVTLLGGISPIDELGSAICNDKRVKSLAASRWAERNQVNFARAWLDGYEIEKEKLYTVEIPNPNSAGGKLVLFKQQSSGRLILDLLNPNINKPKYLHLTESEIKQDFEWAWQWAKPIEEN